MISKMSRCGVCSNKQLRPNGCQVPVIAENGNALVCGETQNLDTITEIMDDFDKKMRLVDAEAGGDCLGGLQAKVRLQQEWITSLRQQNELLVQAVKGLEVEATRKASKIEEISSEYSFNGNKLKTVLDIDELCKCKDEDHPSNTSMHLYETVKINCTDSKYIKRVEELESDIEKAICENEKERRKKNLEINNLKETIYELEKALQNAQSQSQDEVVRKTDCSVLKKEIKKLSAENQHQCSLNAAMTQKLNRLESELQISNKDVVNCNELKQSIQELQDINDALHTEISVLQQDLNQNKTNATQIEELYHCIEEKMLELQALQEKCSCTQKELETAFYENNKLKNEVCCLMERNACYEQQTTLNSEHADYCQREIKNCNQDLNCLNEKLIIMKKLLFEKDEQYSQLEKLYCVQANQLECSKQMCEEAKTHYENDVADLKRLVNCNEQQSLQELQKINDALHIEINVLHQELNQNNANVKSAEVHQLKERCICAQKQLDAALCENDELKNEVECLIERNACYEQQTVLNDEHTDYCQREIESCSQNLQSVNAKLIGLKQLLFEKDEQYVQLESLYQMQANATECSKQTCEDLKLRYENDVAELKQMIQELNNKLNGVENNYHSLHEDYKNSQMQILDASHRETKLQHDYVQSAKELSDKLQLAECEEARIRDYARQVETQNNVLRNDLTTLQRQVELLKAQLSRLKSAAISQTKHAQDETNGLKNELDKMIQQHSKLKLENDSLRTKISQIQAYEQQNRVTGEQLDQCLCELRTVQIEKQRLEIANQKFITEFKSLQAAYRTTDRNHQQLSQYEVCTCNCKERQRGGTSRHKMLLLRSQIQKPNIRVCVNDTLTTSSTSYTTNDWDTDTESDEDSAHDMEYPDMWVKKVESITQELKKSTEYWKNQILENDEVTRDQ